MDLQELKEIFENVNVKLKGDTTFEGLKILKKYSNDTVIQGASHDIIYSYHYYDIIDKLTSEDAKELAKLNWMLDSNYDCFACFV